MNAFDVSFRAAPQRICTVRVGAGALDLLVEELAERPPARLLVLVSDSHVMPLHGEPLMQRLRARGLTVEGVTIPAGERNKTRETKAWLEDRLLEFGAGQDTALLAVGGA